MEWLIVIAQMCQISVTGQFGGYGFADSDRVQRNCQRQLIECVEKEGGFIIDAALRKCVLKRAKGELK